MAIASHHTDFELIDRVIDGDKASFEVLVKRHQSLVASTAMNMLGDMEEAKEIGQQVFIRFYKSIHKFKKEAKLSTYLSRITINLCLNHLKRQKSFRNRQLNIDNAYSISEPHFSNTMETKEIINKALQKLDDHYRSVIVLRMIQGYSTLESAEILGVPKGTVLSRLKRGMDKLKIILKTEFNYA